MRVTYFIDSLGSGGAQRQIVELAVSLARRGLAEPRVLVYHDNDFFTERLAEYEIPIERLARSSSLDPTFPLRLRRKFLSDSPDVLHAFLWAKAAWAAVALLGLPRSSRPAFLASERNSQIALSAGMKAAQMFAYRSADFVTANYERVMDEMIAKLGLQPDRLAYIPNGIDLAKWDDLQGLPTPLEFPAGFIHLGVVGRLEPQKNHSLLTRALTRLDPQLRAKLRVWYIGRDSADEGYNQKIKREVESLGLSETVTFTGAQPNVAALMRALDAVILSSVNEGFPNVVMEAFASRAPVVVTDVGDVRNIVREGESGFIVPSNDVDALAAAIARLCTLDPAARRDMGLAGRARIESNFQIDHIADRYLELYERLAVNR
jgi:glycosyltransferase involved in cell wall biosynthesis